jgi:hypothetical protein
MFPDGGMWEKRRFVAKEGAPTLAAHLARRFLPVGSSGTYLKTVDCIHRPEAPWRSASESDARCAAQSRPPRPQRRPNAASAEIMARIWELLERRNRPATALGRARDHRCRFDFLPRRDRRAGWPTTARRCGYGRAGRIYIAKPNLFRPMWENAG